MIPPTVKESTIALLPRGPRQSGLTRPSTGLTDLEPSQNESNALGSVTAIGATSSALERDALERDAFAVWRSKVQGLSAEQRKEFLAHQRDGLASYVSEFEDIARRQGGGHAYRIAALIKPLWNLSKVLAPIASDPWLSQLDPSHASLVLGGLSYLLSISGKLIDYHDRVIDCTVSMLERLQVVEKFEALYEKHGGDDLRDAAITICADVLQFCVEASKLFVDDRGKARGSARILLSSIWSSFEAKFGQLNKDFEKHVKLFETYAQLASARRQEGFMRDREERDKLDDEESFQRVKNEEQLRLMELTRSRGKFPSFYSAPPRCHITWSSELSPAVYTLH